MPPKTATSRDLSPPVSVLLDVTRFCAALAVVVDHLSLPEFHTGWPDRQWYGWIAVPVFFVLSGFVIRFVTRTRETTLSEYLIDRTSRIYSVVLPAMLLTLVLTAVCFALRPAEFRVEYAGQCTQPFLRVLLNLTFISQAWGHNIIPFLNIPFWSMGYECPYYILYGLAFFLRGPARYLAFAAAALLFGPQVLLLLVVWILGCAVYDLFAALRNSRAGRAIAAATGLWLAVGGIGAAFGRKTLLVAPLSPFRRLAVLPNPLELLHQPEQRAGMVALSAGFASAVALLLLLLLVDSIPHHWFARAATPVRRVADGTFSIYLMHFPLLVTAHYLGLLGETQRLRTILSAVVICVFLIWLAGPLDALKRAMRRLLRARFPAKQPIRAVSA